MRGGKRLCALVAAAVAVGSATAAAAPARTGAHAADTGNEISESGVRPDVLGRADISVPPLAPPVLPFSAVELASVASHVRNNLTADLYDNFQLFLYVSKAAAGPWAQHMFVLTKKGDGALDILDEWPVSTGRERNETNAAGAMLPSFTPQGYYQLDPDRMYVSHRSVQWGEEMPYAMFFNWTREGHATGLAIHAATDDETSLLGTRASAGCVRLSASDAKDLFELIEAQYHGAVPMFEPYARSGAPGNGGILLVNHNGSLRLAEGYQVLVFIDDFGGTPRLMMRGADAPATAAATLAPRDHPN